MAAIVLSIDTIVSDPSVRGGRPSIQGRSMTVADLMALNYDSLLSLLFLCVLCALCG